MTLDNVDIKEWTLKGGVKTRNGKDRIVPIHPRIRPFIQTRYENNIKRLFEDSDGEMSTRDYYEKWKNVMNLIHSSHTPHECRHTFETMLDNAGGNRKCIDLLMGHKSTDTGNRVYNHKTLQQLRETTIPPAEPGGISIIAP